MKTSAIALRLSDLVGGAAEERFIEAFGRILENIADPNTDAEEQRKLTIEMKFKPAKSRERFDMAVTVKTKTAARSSVSTVVFFGRRNDGSWEATEWVPPTQLSLNEAQAPAPEEPIEKPATGALVPGRFDGRKSS